MILRRNRVTVRRFLFGLLVIPMLACGPITQLRVTPTPTKTPSPLPTLAGEGTPTATTVIVPTPAVIESPPTDTPAPAAPPTDMPPAEPETQPDTPAPEAAPPTDTPAPPPPPTNTPLPPPPPPTNTPVPPPPAPTNTPAPPPPPANSGPVILIELPRGDRYGFGDEIELIITVRDPDGVKDFSWGVFTANGSPVFEGDKDCGNATECKITEEFEAPRLQDAFQIGVEAQDATGQENLKIVQLYIG